MIATVVTTVTATTTVDTLVAEATEGSVKFHTFGGNGKYRRVQFLAEGTVARDTAEWITAQRNEGRSMKSIAAEMHVSQPTVRRMINALVLTQEVEEDADELLAGEVWIAEAAALTAGPLQADGTF